jgi:hypothetical protein
MFGHDEDEFVNTCDRMPRRTQRSVDETKENAMSAYRRAGVSASMWNRRPGEAHVNKALALAVPATLVQGQE